MRLKLFSPQTRSLRAFWVYVAATHDGFNRRLYVDGVEVAADTQNGFDAAVKGGLVIGSTLNRTGLFSGLGDEIKIFGRALTSEEVKGLFDKGLTADRPDAAITFTAGATQSVTEGDSGQANLSINFTRGAGGGAGNMQVTIAPLAGGTTQGASGNCGVNDDYVVQPNPVTVVWAANETVKSFGIGICGDTVPEPAETFTVTIDTVPGGDSGAGAAQVVTINDNDATVTVTAVGSGGPAIPGFPNAAFENPGFGDFTFTRAPGAPVNFPLTVNFNKLGTSTADDGDDLTTGGLDYTFFNSSCAAGTTYSTVTNSGTVVIPTGQTSCVLSASYGIDSRVEPNETINLQITAGSYVIGAQNAATAIIQNDDFSTVFMDAQPITNGVEGNPGAAGFITFDPARTAPVNSQLETLNVRFEITGTATCQTTPDYTIVVNGTNRITQFACTGPNTGRGVFTLQGTELDPIDLPVIDLVADPRVEPDDTVTFTILAFNAAGVGDPGAGNYNNSNTYTVGNPAFTVNNINDDDETITVASANSPLSEAGPGGIQFNVVRNFNSVGGPLPDNDPAVTDPLTVNFSISSLAPTATQASCTGSDFTVSSGSNEVVTYTPATCTGTIVFPGSDVAGQIVVTPVNDNLPENNETFTLTITPNTGAPANNYGIGPVVGPDGAVSGTATADLVRSTTTTSRLSLVSTASVTEGSPSAPNATNLIYAFTRIGETNNPTCANFNATGVSASALTDYTTSFGAATVALYELVHGNCGCFAWQHRYPCRSR
ncbi:MAG: hypothetical protein IPG22_17395 [Acidobacteria bacterium]|nr:hypothetical protein [Acidobacteriota bacterium]